ncbi:hypothetical protein TSA6c_00470 [Azospirillum sp. TSA6c]|uniref:phage head spike fiber domain-containing protein n=1 Tax=Azospirillum sp. TSA6c TaxID=709813 RepID=UPI000D614C7E|nr:hypothetical protein [Azospirillum sp. TSA6c]PWC54373.1 hypothetical protein TSA6c_00470 [Azospirillum sp. TSA6c]
MTNPVWDGVTIDYTLLQNYGWYNTTVTTSDGQTYPRLVGYQVAGLRDMSTALTSAQTASTAAVAAAAQAVPAATTATTQAAIAVAAANTAVGTSLIKQPSEIAGIDPALDFYMASALALPAGVVTSASAKYVFDRAGLLTSVASLTPPIDFDPVTSVTRGLPVEPAATNLLRYSQQFENAVWSTFGTVTVTANNATAPDGTATADKLVISASSGIYQLATVTAGTYTASVWLRADSPVTVSLASNDSPSSGAATTSCSVTTVWQRFSVTKTTPNTSLNLQINGPATVYAWQGQLEAGSFATSPILTTSSTATRAADANTLLLSSVPGWNASEGTIYVEARTALASGTQTYAQYDDGTANNRLCVYRDSSNVLRCVVVVSGSTVVNLNLGAVANDTFFKVAFAWKANSFAASVNGGAAVTSSSGAIPSGLTTHRIGHDSSGNHANAPIRRDVGFPRALPSTVQLLTA